MSAMVITAGTASTDTLPMTLAAPIVESKATWGDDWEYDPQLQFVSCAVHASSSAPSSAMLQRRYGNIKHPWESDFSNHNRDDLVNWWIRVSFIGSDGPAVQFVGQIQDQATNLLGAADAAGTTAGIEEWVAAGGLNLLRKLTVHQSYFLNDDNEIQLVDWIPEMNARDKRGLLVGNMVTFTDDDDVVTHWYGGDETWTHLDYVNYLVDNFIQQADGPAWTVGGQTDVLAGMQTTIKFREGGSVLDMLRQLIPPKYGVDFQVMPTADATDSTFTAGFEISVFALTGEDRSVAGVTMPKNPNTVTVDRTAKSNMIQTHIVESAERRVDKVRVVGKRIVVCGTLSAQLNELVPKWTPALEAEYIAASGAPSSDPVDLDKFRAREKYRTVYQHYGAPTNWDMGGGVWSVQCDLNGDPVASATTPAASGTNTPAQFQTSIRETLSWIPLKEGFDYRTDPPTDNNISGHEPDMKPPQAWVYDSGASGETDYPQFSPCHAVGISVSTPHLDWGVFLNASPNHKLAYTHWTDAQIATSDHDPEFDWETLVATIAIESDHRLQVGYDMPDDLAAGDGSVMTIVDDDAELWVMLPETAVDTDAPSTHITYSGAGLRVLRNDADRLKLALAGVVSRYINERCKATFRFKGLLAWSFMLGQIMQVVQQGDDSFRVGAPITGIEWHMEGSPETVIKVGYA